MAVTIERALDEPIARFMFTGTLDRDTVAHTIADAFDLLDSLGSYYAALDIRQLDTPPDDFLAAFAPSSGGLSLLNEPRIAPLLITNAPLPDHMPLNTFDTLDAAITFARLQYAARQPGDPLL